jgi:hypothetical protein
MKALQDESNKNELSKNMDILKVSLASRLRMKALEADKKILLREHAK